MRPSGLGVIDDWDEDSLVDGGDAIHAWRDWDYTCWDGLTGAPFGDVEGVAEGTGLVSGSGSVPSGNAIEAL